MNGLNVASFAFVKYFVPDSKECFFINLRAWDYPNKRQ